MPGIPGCPQMGIPDALAGNSATCLFIVPQEGAGGGKVKGPGTRAGRISGPHQLNSQQGNLESGPQGSSLLP